MPILAIQVEFMKLRTALIALITVGTVMLPHAGHAIGPQPTLNQIDQHIAAALSDITNKAGSTSDGSDVSKANWKLLAYIKEACERQEFLRAPLKKAQEAGLNRVTSSDGKLCIYCWDTLTGGTMHNYWALAQYQDGNEVLCDLLNPGSMKETDDGEGGYWYDKIRTIKTKDNKTVYLVTGGSRGSTIDFGDIIEAYSIDKGQFALVPIFQTKTKLLDQIEIEVHGAEPVEILVSDDNQKVSVPIITKDGTPTDRFLVYKFNGSKFVFDPKLK